MDWRTGTFCHGFRLGGSRMMPAGMSIVPGVATPMAAMSDSFLPAAAMALRMGAAIWLRPCSCPLEASVGRVTDEKALPASSTAAAFMVVPPTSSPTYNRGELIARSALGGGTVAPHGVPPAQNTPGPPAPPPPRRWGGGVGGRG